MVCEGVRGAVFGLAKAVAVGVVVVLAVVGGVGLGGEAVEGVVAVVGEAVGAAAWVRLLAGS